MAEWSEALMIDGGATTPPAPAPPRADAGGLKPTRRVARAVAARYLAVLSTYPRRWAFRVWAALLVGFLIAIFTISSDAKERASFLLMQLTTVAVVSAATLAEHAKEQLLDARAVVTPRFRTPHLVVW